eukprot:TRINITY_DN3508_c0_g2_i1.p1 TRINITY_DN3508_c0_g2~~TRINITY_DN3508_c0_g2_i1.p1  ORF type:complete len:416 (+),score=121.25 TRINITY_DN3508_c0_g2_i1:132-1379(+)
MCIRDRYSGFEEALSGISTIRAFRASNGLMKDHIQLLLQYVRPTYFQNVATEWLSMRLTLIGACISLIVSLLCVFEHSNSSDGNAAGAKFGFTLTYAMQITQQLTGFVMAFTTAEATLVSLERLLNFANLPPEAPLEQPEDPPAELWPSEGAVRFDNVVMRYRDGLDPVLKGLTFDVNPGEKVGICGRTGAGKSSVLVALFRLAELHSGPASINGAEVEAGSIYIDGRDIKQLGLRTLRTRITIIPQDPVLFSGTLLSNLDPAGTMPQEKLWDVLKQVKLDSFIRSRDGQLEMTLDANGENLSVGQRQLLCLARALLRGSKVMVLDEATASIDRRTDIHIQDVLSQLKGITTLTIAHRIDTILESDRVLVLTEGRCLEYDNPQALCDDPQTEFAKIVQEYHAQAAAGEDNMKKDE